MPLDLVDAGVIPGEEAPAGVSQTAHQRQADQPPVAVAGENQVCTQGPPNLGLCVPVVKENGKPVLRHPGKDRFWRGLVCRPVGVLNACQGNGRPLTLQSDPAVIQEDGPSFLHLSPDLPAALYGPFVVAGHIIDRRHPAQGPNGRYDLLQMGVPVKRIAGDGNEVCTSGGPGQGLPPIFQKCAVEIGDEGNFQAGEGLRQAGAGKGIGGYLYAPCSQQNPILQPEPPQ